MKKGKFLTMTSALAVIVLLGVPMAVFATDANGLATQINGWNGGGGGSLSASAVGNEVTVTSTVTNATSTLVLNIDAGVTVIWRATLSNTTGSDGAIRFVTTGTGAFRLESDGSISTTERIAVSISSAVTITVNGGTISSVSRNAIQNNANGARITINNGTVSSGSLYAINNANWNATVTINGGIVSSNSGHAISNAGSNNVVIINDGTVSSTDGVAVNNTHNNTVTINGGTVSSTNGNAVNNTIVGTGTVTINEGATIIGHLSGNNIIDNRNFHVPPTGLPDLTAAATWMYILIALSLALWGYVGYTYIAPRRKIKCG